MPNGASYRIEIFSRKRRGTRDLVHYFRIVEENGQTVTPSQGYSRAIDRDKTVNNLKTNLHKAEVIHV